MKKVGSVIGALSVSMVLLMGVAAAEWKASATGLYCADLRKCTGEAGCPSGGSVTGCEISCVNGGTAWCNVAEGELE